MPHHPIPGNMWTEVLSTADRPQKKKKKKKKTLEALLAKLMCPLYTLGRVYKPTMPGPFTLPFTDPLAVVY